MAQCISRRACADRDTIRLTNDKGQIGKHIWTEYRCPNVVSKDDEECADCRRKLPKYKYQANQKCDHGIIGGPYTSHSKLYGSPYYLKEIQNGWKILEMDEMRAKEAVLKASSEMAGRKKKVTEQQVVEATGQPVEQTVPEQPLVKVKKPRTKKAPVEEKPAARGRPRKVKLKEDVLLPVVEVLEESEKEPKFIETIQAPIRITDCIVVKVKKIKCQGKDYYYDELSRKLYGISVNGVGAYKGRYNAEEDLVDTTFPDSDSEEA